MNCKAIGFLLGVAVCASGCHSGDNGPHSLSNEDAARIQSSRDSFQPPPPSKITPETHFAAGQLAETQSNFGGAVEQYQITLKVDPKHLGALYRLGVLYTSVKKYPEALGYWQRYVAATDESPTALSDLAFCDELAGKLQDAEANYQKGIAKDPKNVPCRVNYGLMLARGGNMDRAIGQWQMVLSPAEVHYNIGSVYQMKGDKDRARAEYEQAIALDDKLDDARSRIASLDQSTP